MSYSLEEYELVTLAKNLGGVSKTKGLLKAMKDNKISTDMLLAYLKSLEYKLPSPIEKRIEDLEKRLMELDGKALQIKALSPETPPTLHKQWSEQDFGKELDYIKKYREYTFLYYKILMNTEGKVSREDLINKISELSGKKFTGFSLAGVLAGITSSFTKHNHERWDIKDEKSQHFTLKEKYREMMMNYFKAKGETLK